MDFDIDKFLDLDMGYPGISFGYQSWSLGIYLESLENFIGIAQEQYRTRAKHQLEINKEQFQPDEYYKQKLFEIDEAADEHIPRYARMSAIIPLWGIFELTITDITKYVTNRENVKLKLSEIRADNLLDKILKYYASVLPVTLPWTEKQIVELQLLYKIRNAIAHRNGQFGDDTEQRKKEIKKAVDKLEGVTLHGYQLEISAEFIKSSSELVFTTLSSLNNLVCERYDGPTAKAN